MDQKGRMVGILILTDTKDMKMLFLTNQLIERKNK